MKVAQYKGMILSLDTIEALKMLEVRNQQWKFLKEITKTDDPTCRCVGLIGDLKKIWSFAVPLGFTPWNRYPVPGDRDHLFYFFGLWQPMMDRLMAMGRGDAVWDSFVTAARLEAGNWPREDRLIERSVQMHLHRLGYNPGPIDGVIGKFTAKALLDAGIEDKLELALQKLQAQSIPTKPKTSKPIRGEFSLPDRPSKIQAFGDIRVCRTDSGATFEIAGSGRIIIDV